METHFTIDHHAGRSIKINGSEYLFFGGTNYLGISSHPVFRENLIHALEKYGTSHGASRNNNLRLSIFEKFENHFAEKYGFEKALVVSSGLMAGQIAASALPQKIIYAPRPHPAIVLKNEKRILKKYEAEYNSFSKNISELTNKISGPFAIATNFIDNLKCESIDFSWLDLISKNSEATILIDYSHGIGIKPLSQNILNAKNKFDIIVCASLAKALGIPAGIIFGNKKTIEKIRSQANFIGASPPSPAFLEAYLNSEKIYEEQFQKLISNIDFFHKKNKTSLSFLENYPVFFTSKNIFQRLFKQNIFISSFSYPSPDSPPLSRIVLSALHTESDILILANALNELV